MRSDLQSVLAAVKTVAIEELPSLVGSLAELQAVALARLAHPAPQAPAIEENSATLDVAQAANHIAMSEKWLYRNLQVVPHLRIGNRIRFRRRDLDNWLQAHSMEIK